MAMISFYNKIVKVIKFFFLNRTLYSHFFGIGMHFKNVPQPNRRLNLRVKLLIFL